MLDLNFDDRPVFETIRFSKTLFGHDLQHCITMVVPARTHNERIVSEKATPLEKNIFVVFMLVR